MESKIRLSLANVALKKQSNPKLELQAALYSVRLRQLIVEDHVRIELDNERIGQIQLLFSSGSTLLTKIASLRC